MAYLPGLVTSGVPEPLANWLILLDLNNHTVVRTGHSFSCWLKDGLTGLAGLDFNAEMGCGQGDVSRPLTWVAVFNILLSVLEDDDPHGGFRLRKRNGDQYAAPDVCFAGDLQSFAATLSQLQRKAERVSGFAAVTGMRIAEHKLCTYHVIRQHDAYQDNRTPRGLWIYSSAPPGDRHGCPSSIASKAWGSGMTPPRLPTAPNWPSSPRSCHPLSGKYIVPVARRRPCPECFGVQ